MKFRQNGLANFFLGCICGYAVANAVDIDLAGASLLSGCIAFSIFTIYCYPID